MPNNFAQTFPDTKHALKAVCSFKDEYLLDFINVEQLNEQEEDLDEKVVEKAIVSNVKRFIIAGYRYLCAPDGADESGHGLCFYITKIY